METDLTYTFPSEDGREQRLRFAVISGARRVEEVAAYLPGNYNVLDSRDEVAGRLLVLISGSDEAGWTMDDYVKPRLASGLMGCEEIREAAWYNKRRFQDDEDAECQGHEHDPGNPSQMAGETYYCDGSCRPYR